MPPPTLSFPVYLNKAVLVYFCTVDGRVRMWLANVLDVSRRSPLTAYAELHKHTDAVTCCRFSPNGVLLLTGGRDMVSIGDAQVYVWYLLLIACCHPLFEENGGILIWVCPSVRPSVPLSVCPSVALWFPCSNCSKNCLISTKFGMQVNHDNTKAKFEGQCNSCRFTLSFSANTISFLKFPSSGGH